MKYLDVEEGEDESGGVQVTSPTDRYVGRAGGWRDTDVDALGDRSKCWVEEEGEIFRQETMLLVSEGTVKEHADKDLRREVGPVPSTVHLLNRSQSHSFPRRWSNAHPARCHQRL